MLRRIGVGDVIVLDDAVVCMHLSAAYTCV